MKMLEQETPLGTLVARREVDLNYPGISIYIRRGEQDELLTNVEYDADGRILAFREWLAPQTYTYSHGEVLSENHIKQIFEENEDDD